MPAVEKSGLRQVFKHGDCLTLIHKEKSWGGIRADLVRRTGLKKEETAFSSESHLILLNLQGNSESGEYFVHGRRASFVRRQPGAVLFVPAGCTWKGWEVGASTAAYLSISVAQAFVECLAGRVPSENMARLSPDLGFEDPIIMNAARGIGAEIGERNPMSTLLVESYATTIFAQLLRRLSYVPRSSKGGLSPAVLNRVIEKIDADMASDMSLSLLADVAGLSVPHFCRAFKQSLGCPPHAYIYRRRLEKVKEHLRHSSMSVTEIALTCGFSSSSHLSNAFRREVGTTPVRYRGSWRIAPSQ
ncbi:hypothetical protein MesoLjLc_14740 [Mesorhizobium sp. L-8-10]|uniref:AraC family transcriptional regulator n=1 Tax=Mesorhizobium sp. L-8-10 TaxID=2744523 RepID=UPI0019279A3A|nr:AraC family transcriptional regulator [Mesorhizobium sp. L-8-10]BCH29544.1 hypothetical protein MesoLjLc_14740 [Mesorhizobium sp. L-8-10]